VCAAVAFLTSSHLVASPSYALVFTNCSRISLFFTWYELRLAAISLAVWRLLWGNGCLGHISDYLQYDMLSKKRSCSTLNRVHFPVNTRVHKYVSIFITVRYNILVYVPSVHPPVHCNPFAKSSKQTDGLQTCSRSPNPACSNSFKYPSRVS
jgi:hypothetical protein